MYALLIGATLLVATSGAAATVDVYAESLAATRERVYGSSGRMRAEAPVAWPLKPLVTAGYESYRPTEDTGSGWPFG